MHSRVWVDILKVGPIGPVWVWRLRMITPVFGLTVDETRHALQSACLAPSLHNSQPWAFRLNPDRIEVFLDASRALPVCDADGRETRLALGAAIYNLRLTLARFGVDPVVRQPDSRDPGAPVAIILRGGDTRLSPHNADLERAIAHRRSNRRPFFDAEVPSGYQQTVVRAAEAERASLALIVDPGRLAHLRHWGATAHRAQLSDPTWVADWTAWTGRQGSADGVPLTSAGPPPAPQDTWTLRDFGAPGRTDRPEGKNFESQPLLAVLGTFLDTPAAQLNAGQALERVLLTATSLGLAVSFLSQFIEVEDVRRQVEAMLGGRIRPQAILRIGFGGPVPATPRRPVEACLLPGVLAS